MTAPVPRRLAVGRPRRAGVLAALLLVLACVLLGAGPAAAHATLEESSPGSGAIVRGMPAQVVLRFSEAVSLLPTSLQVYAPDGSRADHGPTVHPGGDSARVSVDLHGTEQGTYLVSWRVVSADSHPISGAFRFSVGRSSAPPAAPSVRPDRTVSALLGVFRWSGYAGVALLGGVVFLGRCWPAGWRVRSVRRLLLVAGVAVALGAVGGLLLKGPYDAARGLGAVGQGALLSEVLGTTYGVALLVRLVLAVLALLLLTQRQRVPARWWWGAAGVLGLALLGSFAAAGHAVSSHPVAVAVVVDMAHVAAMSVWLGGMALLAGVALRRPTEDTGSDGDASIAAARFSPIALGAVAVLVLTGSYQSWRQLGAWGAFAETTYGRELLVKLALVASVLVVAAVSRALVRRNVPGTLVALRRTVALEAAGAVLVLAVTSALVATEPGRTAYHPSVSTSVQVGPDTVQLSAVPAGDRRMALHLDVLDGAGRPTDPPEISATLARGSVGPLPVTLVRHGTGQRMATLSVPVAGDWKLTVRVRTTAIDEDSAVVTLPIR